MSGVVYAVECVGYNAVKVGWARDAAAVSMRIKTHQVGNPHELRLAATRVGDMKLEKRLHHEWRTYRIRGEWFTRDVLALFEGAQGSNAVVLRCIDCGCERHVNRIRQRSSGRCRACKGKHASVLAANVCAACGASGAKPYNNSHHYALKLCATCKATEKQTRKRLAAAKVSVAMRGNQNAVGRSARGRVLLEAA